MSVLEQRVRPFLERMMGGDAVTLQPEDKALLAEYLTFKLFLFDWIENDPMLTLEQSKAFHESGVLPPNLRIYLFNCMEGDWRCRSSGFQMRLHPEGESMDTNLPPNTKSFAVGMGNLFIFALTCGVAEMEVNHDPRAWVQLWPIMPGMTRWPPEFPITSLDAEFICNALWRLPDYIPPRKD